MNEGQEQNIAKKNQGRIIKKKRTQVKNVIKEKEKKKGTRTT